MKNPFQSPSDLKSSHAHHKHIHPDIKHNRIPAANKSFTKPNIVGLIQEIERLIKSHKT